VVLTGRNQADVDRATMELNSHYPAIFDTVYANPADWSSDPWTPWRDGDLIFGRGAVDSKGAGEAMIAAVEAITASGLDLGGPLYFMSDADGEGSFRGAALMQDLKLSERIGTIISAEATSNQSVEIAYPGISTWKVTAIGRTAHPTQPEQGANAIEKMSKLVQAVAAGRLKFKAGKSRGSNLVSLPRQ
jgi:acetylornithine deacetylase/succinyl-diaminopimelate desuccinylase-like protein